MQSLVAIGIDVHKDKFALVAVLLVLGAQDQILGEVEVGSDYKEILAFIESIKKKSLPGQTYSFVCGYEAGCLGYVLYHQLTAAGVRCVIMAPTTMLSEQGKRIKTDRRDARLIAKCLCCNGYHPVYIPTAEDEDVRDYLRMRDDHQGALKKLKQQINAFVLRHGCSYVGTKWTARHIGWLMDLQNKLDEMQAETLKEYMLSYAEQKDKIERFDEKIEEIARMDRYSKLVSKLVCFLGVKTHTALSLIVETGDFMRFAKGYIYAASLGLAPGEHSSGSSVNRLGITKAGNKHLRTLLIEAAGGICKGAVGHKSKALKARQAGQDSEVIAYADKANTRLRSKYYRMVRRGKKRNVAVAAVARELACFIWGMATGNTGLTRKTQASAKAGI